MLFKRNQYTTPLGAANLVCVHMFVKFFLGSSSELFALQALLDMVRALSVKNSEELYPLIMGIQYPVF